MHASIREILDRNEQPFNIVDAFAQLSSRRKVLVCDHLFLEGRRVFQQTVALLWPDSTARDVKILEKYLHAIKRAAQ
jgi:hypothetical protein